MVVIDPQFSLSEAHKLTAGILETKKRLTTIYSTHAHPDHVFGLAVLKQAFPEAKIVALPATVNAAKTGWPARQKFWFPVAFRELTVRATASSGYRPSRRSSPATSCSTTSTSGCRATPLARTG